MCPMDDSEWLAEQFEANRTRLRAVAYRMLGSMSEADDAVQESWLRLSGSDSDAIDNLGGWLTTVVGRVSLDMLRSRKARHEAYVGTWLPEPIVSTDEESDPEVEALLEVLDPDVVFRVDSGTEIPVVSGAPAVARQVLARGTPFAPYGRPAIVNGAAGVVVVIGGRLRAVASLTVMGGRIAEIDIV